MKLKVAPSHLVLDLLDLSRLTWNVRFDKHKKSSFLTYFTHYEYGFHQKTQGGSSQEEVPEKLAFATDDEWVIDEANMELIRVHKQMRKAKYTSPRMDTHQFNWSCWTPSARRSRSSTRARPMSRKMTGAPVRFLPPNLLSLGRVGLSLGYLLEVSRVKPRYRLRRVILPEARRDHQRILSAKGSLKTARGEQEQPEVLHTEAPVSQKESSHQGKHSTGNGIQRFSSSFSS